MKKQYLFILISLLFIGFNASAQDFPVPENYALREKDDYTKYQPDFIKTVDWLQQTAWTTDTSQLHQASAFILAWVSGSPDVTIAIGNPIIDITQKNPYLLITYMGQYAKYALNHKDDFDADAANAAALRALIAKYNAEPTHVKDKKVEKLAGLDRNGKLETWIKTDFNKNTSK